MALDQKQWEYCCLTGIGDLCYYPHLTFFTKEGYQGENLSGGGVNAETIRVEARITQLGEDGWEMVGVVSSGKETDRLYFKRQKA